MPSYDYRCKDCSSNVTLERSMTDESKPLCSECGSENINRLWTAFILNTAGSTPDMGQGGAKTSASKKSGCGSCSTHSCHTC